MVMEIIEEEKRQSKSGAKIHGLKVSPPFETISNRVLIGFDPGTTHIGIATIWRNVVHIYEIGCTRSDDPVVRILLTQEILSECCRMFDFSPRMVIEGSSFCSNYRQSELAEVRASAVLWAIQHGIHPLVVPPLTIRKIVFGSAKMRAEQVWENVPPNAASALACAYYELLKSAPAVIE